MGKEQWQTLLVLGAILLVGFFFQDNGEDLSGEAVRRSVAQAPVFIPTQPAFCGYQSINQQFFQRL